jgi:putative membrane protein
MQSIVQRYFSAEDLDRIEQAISVAEESSDGEIAVVIAPRSRSWLIDPWLWASVGSIVAVGIVLLWSQGQAWDMGYDFTMSAVAGFAAFVLTMMMAYPLISSAARRRTVWKAALHAFGKLNPTRAQTGVLIYISLDEKNAAVIADKAIAEKLSENYWLQPYQAICGAFTSGNPVDGVVEAITTIGNELANHFPRSDDDINELPNRPIIAG